MGLHEKTLRLIEAAREILAEHHPMTVRQVFYQLVSCHRKHQEPVQRRLQGPGTCQKGRDDPVGVDRGSPPPSTACGHVGRA